MIGKELLPTFDLIPLVEIVPGKQTSAKTIASLKAFCENLDKVPLVLKKEMPGYLENRLTAALCRKATDLVINDVATVEDADKTIWAAVKIASMEENRGKMIVAILPDIGELYMSTGLFD